MAGKVKTWVWVVVGVLFVMLVLAVGGVIFTVAFFRQSMTVADMSPTSADSRRSSRFGVSASPSARSKPVSTAARRWPPR